MSDIDKPAVTVDIILWRPGGDGGQGEILLIQRKHPPFAGSWALPGGFVDKFEPLETAARRELHEEAGLAGDFALEQCGTFGDPGRDPRGWTISVAFCGRLQAGEGIPQAGDDAAKAAWHPWADLPPLAFDHDKIIHAARTHLGVA